MVQAPAHHALSDGKPGAWDWIFLGVLAASLAGAAWVGVLAYQEGLRTEQTKRTGEAWVQWLAEQAEARSDEGYGHADCAAKSGNSWGPCRAWLFGSGGPMHEQRSAFGDRPMRLVKACDSSDRSAAGMIALEKVTALPPGSAIPFVVSPLLDSDAIDQRITIRVTACDKASGPIRIGESEF